MALPSGPSSGQISLAMIYLEIYGSFPTNASLRSLSSAAGKTVPDSVGEFYGYSHPISVTVNGSYMDNPDPNTDFISSGTVWIKTYPSGTILATWSVTPTGSMVDSFTHVFTGIAKDPSVYAECSVSVTLNGMGVSHTDTWGFGYPGSNSGNVSDPFNVDETVNFGFWLIPPP